MAGRIDFDVTFTNGATERVCITERAFPGEPSHYEGPGAPPARSGESAASKWAAHQLALRSEDGDHATGIASIRRVDPTSVCRVVLDNRSVRELTLAFRDQPGRQRWWQSTLGTYASRDCRSPEEAFQAGVDMLIADGARVREVVMPGERTRAELIAERDATAERERFFSGLVSEVVRVLVPRDGEPLGDAAQRALRERDEAVARLTRLADIEANVNRAQWRADDEKLATVTAEREAFRVQRDEARAISDQIARERDGAVADASGWEDIARERKTALDGWRDNCARLQVQLDAAIASAAAAASTLVSAREDAAADMRERILNELRYITADDERAVQALPLIAPRDGK